MKLATFNLYQFAEPPLYWYERVDRNTYRADAWQRKRAWIVQQLAALDADVVGFQEVFSVEALKALAGEAGYPHVHAVEEPVHSADDDEVYVKPVVAIASRLPLADVAAVTANEAVIRTLRLGEGFSFSRTPLCAQVALPGGGHLQVYVAHLKSKRPVMADVQYGSELDWADRVRDTMERLSCGNIAALLQRGAEATLVYHHAAETLSRDRTTPIVVLGDLNDDEESIILRALTMSGRIYDIGGIPSRDWPSWVKGALHDYRLADSFRIAPNMVDQVRPFTHIYRGKGGVLDYVLVSNALNGKNPRRVGEVSRFEVLNQHLQSDGVGDREQSDHGQVVIELNFDLTSPEEPDSPPIGDGDGGGGGDDSGGPGTQPPPSEPIRRQDFIDTAGGVWQSDREYREWGGADKWANFWAFFFDTDHGWVKSVYGAIPVDTLHQKQRYSIEHIIPRSFLDRYLARGGAPTGVRKGATVNPFNFIPCERQLNSNRSSFPFDFEGDAIKRPYRIDLNPDAYGTTGLDAEREWVIPTHSRGEIARAILYMVLVYGIDELYNRHVETLVHWAKVDVATPWELAYNEWVAGRTGIRNPFIDTPERARLLLDNETLMSSPVLKVSD